MLKLSSTFGKIVPESAAQLNAESVSVQLLVIVYYSLAG